jgi:hypothetical protein
MDVATSAMTNGTIQVPPVTWYTFHQSEQWMILREDPQPYGDDVIACVLVLLLYSNFFVCGRCIYDVVTC